MRQLCAQRLTYSQFEPNFFNNGHGLHNNRLFYSMSHDLASLRMCDTSKVNRPCSSLERSSFLTLPREVRDLVYEELLYSPHPIQIYRYKLGRRTKYGRKRNCYLDAGAARRPKLGLLRCSRLIAAEASRVFYGRNTFRILGLSDLRPVVRWLQRIGKNNCSRLNSIEAGVCRPIIRHLIMFKGELSDQSTTALEFRLFPRHRYFADPIESLSDYLQVGSINPAFDELFSILGRVLSTHTFKLKLTLPQHLFPDVTDRSGEDVYIMTMNLPNLIEKSRALKTRRRGLRDV